MSVPTWIVFVVLMLPVGIACVTAGVWLNRRWQRVTDRWLRRRFDQPEDDQ